jgi:hypothetical protein
VLSVPDALSVVSLGFSPHPIASAAASVTADIH